MSVSNWLPVTAADYDLAADEYMANLPLEHFMEATVHAMQREITVASLRLLCGRRPDVHLFNELLVQYKHAGALRQVVPDNMLVLGALPDRNRKSYPVDLEPAKPYMMLEYVSPDSKQKDYRDSFSKYQWELRTPYCLFFQIEAQDLQVHRHDGQRYQLLKLDAHDKIAIDRLDLELGLLDGWVRYWHQGDLLELPLELVGRLESQSRQLESQAEQLHHQSQRIQTLEGIVAVLRRQVEKRARGAHRQDILDQLPVTDDADQLERWLDELA